MQGREGEAALGVSSRPRGTYNGAAEHDRSTRMTITMTPETGTGQPSLSPLVSRALVAAALVLVISPWGSPPLALLLGIALSLAGAQPWPGTSKRWSRVLLRASVVGLGFGMSLPQVWHAGRSGFLYTAVGIMATLVVGTALGRLFRVHLIESFLVTLGTAICGGSAIAAVGPLVRASDAQMSVSLGTVFVLNAIALLVFPAIGSAVHLTGPQFGLWAALAIHDTSSVVGASAKYGAEALAVGTTVKLARALWIVPVALGTAFVTRQGTRVQWPWFIAWFVVAAMLNSFVPAAAPVFLLLRRLAGTTLLVTLFLIGTQLSRTALQAVGPRLLFQGVVLWIVVAVVSLAAILAGLVAL